MNYTKLCRTSNEFDEDAVAHPNDVIFEMNKCSVFVFDIEIFFLFQKKFPSVSIVFGSMQQNVHKWKIKYALTTLVCVLPPLPSECHSKHNGRTTDLWKKGVIEMYNKESAE